MIRQAAKRLAYAMAPDPQTLVLLRSGAQGAGKLAGGLMTAGIGWTAPILRKWAGDNEAISQPAAYPIIDLAVDDPVASIVASPAFAEPARYFAELSQAERALVPAETQGLLYVLIRNLRPDCVIEIGTYRASTSKAMVRALQANGHGFMHTVDPANNGAILRLVRRWPAELRDRLCYYPMSSMDFFNLANFQRLTSDLVFVDGNHDYEYALFDIQSAARLVRPGGFIAIDNINQAGPFYAAQDFLRDHPSWRECGHCLEGVPVGTAFDRSRSTIAGTDLCVIRAPRSCIVGRRLETAGPQKIAQREIGGIAMTLARPASGTLHAQYVVRVREPLMSEATAETSVPLHEASGSTRVTLPWVFASDEIPLERTIELWLSWSGDGELELSEPPVLF